jgi:hypothetical protein
MWPTAVLLEEEMDNHERHRRVEDRTVITPGKRRNAQQEIIRDFQREDRETNSRNSQRIAKNQELDLVER